ncbi:MAG: hypothetical protein ACT4QD_21675 [Acidobacteriota bacterium]
MATATQLNLRLDNDIGQLAKLCRDLANGGVNLLALAATDSPGRTGVIRLVVANAALARDALARAGYSFEAEEVLFVELRNRPGALAKAAEKLQRAGIDVKYAYATVYRRAQKTAAVIAVGSSDLDRASRLFAGH